MKKPLFVDGEAWFGDKITHSNKLILMVSGKNDRFGSQYSAQMSAFALARYNDCIYRSDLKGTNIRRLHLIFVV